MSDANEIRRRPGGRNARVRAAALSATLEVLAEVGPGGLTIAEVAKRAHIHETSIYRNWGTREELVLDAMSELRADLLPMPDTGTLREDLVQFGLELVAYGNSPLGQAFTRTMAGFDDTEEVAAARAQFWRDRFDESGQMVTRAQERGELPKSVVARDVIEAFIAPIHFRLLLTREEINREVLERLAHHVVSGFGA